MSRRNRRAPVPLASVLWDRSRLAELVTVLARESGLSSVAPSTEGAGRVWPVEVGDEARLEAAAAALGVAATAVEAAYFELPRVLARLAPGIVALPSSTPLASAEEPRYVGLLSSRGRQLVVLAPDHRCCCIDREELERSLRAPLEAPLAATADRLLDDAEVAPARRPRARQVLLETLISEQQGAQRLHGLFLLELPAAAPLWFQARRAGLFHWLALMVGAHAVQHLLLVASWWVLGKSIFSGRLDGGWLAAWALLFLTIAPFRTLEIRTSGRLTTRAGALFKRRLMNGVLALEPGAVRHQGIGQFLGRVIGSEALEFLVLAGGHVGLIATVELVLALPVLFWGSSGLGHVLLLVLVLALTFGVAWRTYAKRLAWTETRLDLTHDLVEQMVGHRTRLAQLAPEHWHEREDRALFDYHLRASAMDRWSAILVAGLPRLWMLLSLLAIAPGFVTGRATVTSLAVALGGTFFAHKALWKLVRGLLDLIEAAISWRQVAPVFHASSALQEPVPAAAPPPGVAGPPPPEGRTVISAFDLSYCYAERAEPVLAGCNLTVRAGERLLLEGPSGSGKSTLGSLLVGLRQPDSGLLLLDGLDHHSLGEAGWRRRAVAAPQFQENHVLVDTFASNLLLGRSWPPSSSDLEEAEALCHELGLGPLLARMPAGLNQMVGESGWQLSHGEKSRLFIARALLQRAELLVFDESFAALDPETLVRCLDTVLRRAPTLVVIAHP